MICLVIADVTLLSQICLVRRCILCYNNLAAISAAGGGDIMNNTERKALVRKISYVLRAATPKQLETVWRYVKWVMFGEGE